MTSEEKSKKMERAERKLKQAQAEYRKALREEKEKERKAQDHHKYMMGGVVVKYFPDAYNFSEQEMNRIIACAFSLKDVRNMIATVKKERPDPEETISNEEDENDDFDSDETEENDPDESEGDEGGDA